MTSTGEKTISTGEKISPTGEKTVPTGEIIHSSNQLAETTMKYDALLAKILLNGEKEPCKEEKN